MVRHTIFYILFIIIILTTGCNERYNELITGYGDVEITISTDTSIVNIAGARGISLKAPSVDEISINATGENGNVKSWKNIGEFESSHKMIPVDKYTFTASSGEIDEGFTSPEFKSEYKAAVFDNELTTVPLNCKVANTIISSEIEDCSSYLKEIELRVKSDNGRYVSFKGNENKPAFLKPGNIKAEMTLTDLQGRKVTLQTAEITDAKSSEHYEIRTSLKDSGNGAKSLSIVYDQETQTNPVSISLNDALFETQPPTIAPKGFVNNQPISIFENDRPENPISCSITSEAGLRHVYLTVLSGSNKAWSKETDLIEYSTDNASANGIKITGNEEGSKSVNIDFSDLISSFTAVNGAQSTNTIIVQAEDITGRICNEPATIVIETNPVHIRLETPQNISLEQSSATLQVDYNGDNFSDNIGMEYMSELGSQWIPLNIKTISAKGDGLYDVTVDIPEEFSMIYIRASYKNGLHYSDRVLLRRSIPDFSVTCKNENIWTSKADLIFTGEDIEKTIKYINIYIRENGGDLHPAVVEKSPEERRITISTLMASTRYDIIAATDNNHRHSLQIVTEEATQLPNGGFENDIKETISIPLINCGGKYSNINSWMPTYNTTSIKASEAKGWASVNAKTCSQYAKTENTWFKVPTTEIISNSHEGGYAVKIRNAAWDINGVEPPRDTRTDNIYYSSNVPKIANRSAGKIFLGGYSFDGTTESYNEGIAFHSRPTGISGYYYYRQDIHDKKETGLVEITVVNEENGVSTVIGKGVGKLTASTSYTLFKVPITYSVRYKKATKLKLMISSSSHSSYSQSEESAKIKTTDYPEKGISTGAELVVDDLKLLYE